jgi:hypothetical protein
MSCRSSFGSSLSFLFMAPLILAFLFVVNVMTGGPWWVQWPALGMGIAWFFSLMRVMRGLVLIGGLAGLAAYLSGRRGF